MLDIWCIQLWIEYLKRENVSRHGGALQISPQQKSVPVMDMMCICFPIRMVERLLTSFWKRMESIMPMS